MLTDTNGILFQIENITYLDWQQNLHTQNSLNKILSQLVWASSESRKTKNGVSSFDKCSTTNCFTDFFRDIPEAFLELKSSEWLMQLYRLNQACIFPYFRL